MSVQDAYNMYYEGLGKFLETDKITNNLNKDGKVVIQNRGYYTYDNRNIATFRNLSGITGLLITNNLVVYRGKGTLDIPKETIKVNSIFDYLWDNDITYPFLIIDNIHAKAPMKNIDMGLTYVPYSVVFNNNKDKRIDFYDIELMKSFFDSILITKDNRKEFYDFIIISHSLSIKRKTKKSEEELRNRFSNIHVPEFRICEVRQILKKIMETKDV